MSDVELREENLKPWDKMLCYEIQHLFIQQSLLKHLLCARHCVLAAGDTAEKRSKGFCTTKWWRINNE